MQFRNIFFAIGLCSMPALASANSQGIDTLKPAAVICVGITAPKKDEQFELICQIYDQEVHDVRSGSVDKEPLPFTKQDTASRSRIPGCDKPGDVVEQGFCLD